MQIGLGTTPLGIFADKLIDCSVEAFSQYLHVFDFSARAINVLFSVLPNVWFADECQLTNDYWSTTRQRN